jgi:hypothetical protein
MRVLAKLPLEVRPPRRRIWVIGKLRLLALVVTRKNEQCTHAEGDYANDERYPIESGGRP